MRVSCFGAVSSRAADQDLQLWFPVQVVHPVKETWALSMQAEVRLQDDITEFSQLVLKPGVHYHLNPAWAFTAGYKYIEKGGNQANEQEPWQEVSYHKTFDELLTGSREDRTKTPYLRPVSIIRYIDRAGTDRQADGDHRFCLDLPKNFMLAVETEFARFTYLISGGATWRF